jgi:2-methylisocitrate lyase-like PEP mutase family enzyme
MKTLPTPAARLREFLTSDSILVAPGAYDALTARMIEHAGFDALYFTGAGMSYTSIGQPDLGLITLTEMVERARQIAQAVDLPVIADIDNGYGGVLNVTRTIRMFEYAGIAGVHMEDQTFPKRCGQLAGKSLISVTEMRRKIQAAVMARRDPDFVVMARSDAFALDGLDALIERGQAYIDAGADVFFVEAAGTTVHDLQAVADAINAPLITDMVEGSNAPFLPAHELEQMGYDIVIFPNSLTRLFARMGLEMLDALRATGTTAAWHDRMFSFSDLLELLGLNELMDLERKLTSESEQIQEER